MLPLGLLDLYRFWLDHGRKEKAREYLQTLAKELKINTLSLQRIITSESGLRRLIINAIENYGYIPFSCIKEVAKSINVKPKDIITYLRKVYGLIEGKKGLYPVYGGIIGDPRATPQLFRPYVLEKIAQAYRLEECLRV